MKLLIVTQSSDIVGGANRSLLDVISLLKNKYGNECFVLAPGEGAFTNSLEAMDVPFFVSKYCQTSFVEIYDWKYLFRWLLFLKASLFNLFHLKRIIGTISEAGPFELIYINDTTNTIGFHISNCLHIPFVWHFRGYQYAIKRYLLNERALRQSRNGMIINISYVMKQYMQERRHIPFDIMTVIHNGVVNRSLGLTRKNERTQFHSPLHCVHCGHVSKAKGMSDSIRAIGILKNRGITNVFLHIAGTPHVEDGESYDLFLKRELISRYDISDLVIFEGEVKDMALLRSQMDVELVCSVAEPFGRTTVEGLQAGLVVIGANSGATPEIIQDGENGILYEQGNPEDLADKIELIYNNVTLGHELSERAVSFSQKHFTMEENVEKINNLFSIIKKNNK